MFVHPHFLLLFLLLIVILIFIFLSLHLLHSLIFATFVILGHRPLMSFGCRLRARMQRTCTTLGHSLLSPFPIHASQVFAPLSLILLRLLVEELSPADKG